MMNKTNRLVLLLFLSHQSLQASKVLSSRRVAPVEYRQESMVFEQTTRNTISSRISKMCVGCFSSLAEQQAIIASRSSSYKVQPVRDSAAVEGVTFKDLQDLQVAQANRPKNETVSLSSGTVTKTPGITEPSISSQETQLSTPQKIKQKPQPAEQLSMLESFTQFFSGKPDVNVVNRQGRTPLQDAVMKQNREEIVRLVKDGANVNVQDHDGNSLLHLVLRKLKTETGNQKAYNGTLSIFKFLIKNNADLNQVNQLGQTPLHVAVQCIDLNAVQYLIKKHADVNRQDSDGNTPLMAVMHSDIPAYIQAKKNPSVAVVANIIKELIAAGADVTIKAKNGRSPVDDVTYLIKHKSLAPEVADYIHDAQFPKIAFKGTRTTKPAPQTPSPYTSISLVNY